MAFHNLIIWKMITLPIPITSPISVSLERLGECTFWSWEWKGWDPTFVLLKSTEHNVVPWNPNMKRFAALLVFAVVLAGVLEARRSSSRMGRLHGAARYPGRFMDAEQKNCVYDNDKCDPVTDMCCTLTASCILMEAEGSRAKGFRCG